MAYIDANPETQTAGERQQQRLLVPISTIRSSTPESPPRNANPVPNTSGAPAAARIENNLTGFRGFYLKVKARIWP